MRPGLPARARHCHRRNGTTTLFAALEVATGAVTDRCHERHGKDELLDFLKLVATAYPRRRLHVVLENHHNHKHDDMTRWLAKNPPGHAALHPDLGLRSNDPRRIAWRVTIPKNTSTRLAIRSAPGEGTELLAVLPAGRRGGATVRDEVRAETRGAGPDPPAKRPT